MRKLRINWTGFLGKIEISVNDYCREIGATFPRESDEGFDIPSRIEALIDKGWDQDPYENDRRKGSCYAISLHSQVMMAELETKYGEDEMEDLISNLLGYQGDVTDAILLAADLLCREKGYELLEGVTIAEAWSHTLYHTGSGHIVCSGRDLYYKILAHTSLNIGLNQSTSNCWDAYLSELHRVLPFDEFIKFVTYAKVMPFNINRISIFKGRFASIEGMYRWLRAYAKEARSQCSGYYDTDLDVVCNEETIKLYATFIPFKKRARMRAIEYGIKERYGKAPKQECLGYLASLSVPVKVAVEQFDLKLIQQLKSQGADLYEAVKIVTYLGRNATLVSPRVAFALVHAKLSTRKWVYAHNKSNEGLLLSVSRDAELYDLTASMDVIKQRYSLLKSGIARDYLIYKKKCDYDNSTLRIPLCHVENADSRAQIIDLRTEDGILEALGLGAATCCCQRFGSAGESAMLNSLENGGFWKAETLDGYILAQGALWLDNGRLVFDNIEFSNNREPESIREILRLWLQKCDYDTVFMGIGYTQVHFGKVYSAEQVGLNLPPYCYTDAKDVEYLKKGGKVLI